MRPAAYAGSRIRPAVELHRAGRAGYASVRGCGVGKQERGVDKLGVAIDRHGGLERFAVMGVPEGTAD